MDIQDLFLKGRQEEIEVTKEKVRRKERTNRNHNETVKIQSLSKMISI